MCKTRLEHIKNLTLHLTLNEKRFLEESIKIFSIRQVNSKEQNIIDYLEQTINSFKESKDKVSCGKQLVNHMFKIRYPIISKKLKLLNKLKVELKQFGIRLSYDKMLERDPKIFLMNGKEIILNEQLLKINNFELNNLTERVKIIIRNVIEIFNSGI